VQCGAFDTTLVKQGVSRARAFASIDVALERSRAASRDRDTGQTNLFGLFDAAVPKETKATLSAGDYADCTPWDRREALVRERTSLGFYVSGHPLERYLRGQSALARFEAVPAAECAGMDDWAVVRLVGMVEGYREKIFKDGGGKIAFLELEDLTGRVTVKVRGGSIDTYSHVLTSGEPVIITGKVSFPRRDDDAPEDAEEGPREPTIFLNEAHLLVDAVKAETKELAIRVDARTSDVGHLTKMAGVLSQSKGATPVKLHVTLETGAEATLLLGRDFRVEVSDPLLSGLERIFGQQVAELR
jgi:DNA polymerase-3 subunit alpha